MSGRKSLIESVDEERRARENEPRLRTALIQKLEYWKRSGWVVTGLENILHLDITVLQKEFNAYERNMQKAHELGKRLRELDVRGFEPAVRDMETRLRDPYNVARVEKELNELAEKIDRKKASKVVIDDVFLMYRDGRLLKHYTRRIKAMDADILSSMMVAVQEFVKDSFREEKGALDEMKYGELKVMFVRGKYIIIASVISGAEGAELRSRITDVVKEIEHAHEPMLKDWDGRMDKVSMLDDYVKKLVE